ncbi:DUF1565 domain-containing protein [Leptolyngbya sp. FACHB-36]|nr:DUF1565 domain-containing protein [Leptolyngbya sp. FACHB-36]
MTIAAEQRSPLRVAQVTVPTVPDTTAPTPAVSPEPFPAPTAPSVQPTPVPAAPLVQPTPVPVAPSAQPTPVPTVPPVQSAPAPATPTQPAIAPVPGFPTPSTPAAPSTSTPSTRFAPAQAGTIYVNPSTGNDGVGAGTSDATPYRTITYALQQAAPGTIVQLAPGTYQKETGEVFPLVLPTNVVLRGDETNRGQGIVITGGDFYISRSFARQSIAILANGNSEIRGVTVTNPNTRGTGIWVESSNPTIQNNTFTDNNREGVFITGTGNPKISQNVFLRNKGNGISTASNAKGEIENNVFEDTGFGLAIGENSSPLVSGNQIRQNVDGIYVNDNARPVLRNNVIEGNKRDGIVATIAAQPDLGTAEIAGNNVFRNNGKSDLNNSTNGTIYSIGNTLDVKKVAGRIEFTAPIAGQPGTSAFQDVQGHWAQAYIEALAQQGIISGFPGGTFRPSDPVTRVQFAAIINKAFAPPPKQAALSFKDISTNFWGYQPILTAVQGGFMRGYPEGTFRPDQRIPRVQVLVALGSGLAFGNAGANVLTRYQDASEIPSWATGVVAAATQRSVVVNYPVVGQLAPNREATRAEVAAIVYQALVNAGRLQAIPSPYIVSGN